MRIMYKGSKHIEVPASMVGRYVANGWSTAEATETEVILSPEIAENVVEEPSESAEVVEEAAQDDSVAYNPDEINAMTGDELKEYAKQNSIDISSASNKKEAKAIIRKFYNN